MAPNDAREATTWTVVLPVKELARAKSRLGGDPGARAVLALAMARDVVAAVQACGSVRKILVVTDDPRAGEAFAGSCLVVPDLPRAGLSAAVAHGAELAAERWPGSGIVALASDLPALTARALADILAHIAPGRSVVADLSGEGTVLLAATPGIPLLPAYEGASLAAHVGSGARNLSRWAATGLRRDVDTVDDLVAALELGVGQATAQAAQAWRAAHLP
ncbi:MAG TPA: 2-phospho-L-lactate guanylyltransferase [Mycobacteriales bacterium]|nr:2-phospho-L-lactate guanylyltransferase [Mycobacteriales bacterium]